jgi:hypothetical protein
LLEGMKFDWKGDSTDTKWRKTRTTIRCCRSKHQQHPSQGRSRWCAYLSWGERRVGDGGSNADVESAGSAKSPRTLKGRECVQVKMFCYMLGRFILDTEQAKGLSPGPEHDARRIQTRSVTSIEGVFTRTLRVGMGTTLGQRKTGHAVSPYFEI